MARERLAIVGTGIAGLGCAHFLQHRFDLTLFEAGAHAGGHSNTIDVPEGDGSVCFDTGFMVFNHVTYPHLTRLFRELEVPTAPTDMSFSVQHVGERLEFCGSSLNHLFAQRRNLLRPRFYRLLRAIHRFNGEAVAALEDPRWREATLGEFVEQRGYGRDFLDLYLVPMSSAVWSTPPGGMLEFPAVTLLRFFHNHGFLGLHTQHPWWTVTGGSREYVRRLVRPLADRIRLRAPVTAVRRGPGGVAVTWEGGGPERFDRVILACHGDQALGLLADARPEEREILREFRYQPNLATIHTDAAVMPRARLAWSSWNYRISPGPDGAPRRQTIYWMNRLQGVSRRADYFVSINGEDTVDPGRVIRRIPYEHPLFTLGAIRSQARLPGLNRREDGGGVYLAGSYFRYGFHEDAFGSAVDLARVLLGGAMPAGWE